MTVAMIWPFSKIATLEQRTSALAAELKAVRDTVRCARAEIDELSDIRDSQRETIAKLRTESKLVCDYNESLLLEIDEMRGQLHSASVQITKAAVKAESAPAKKPRARKSITPSK